MSDKPVTPENSCHDHGNCELCDHQERELAALKEKLAEATNTIKQLTAPEEVGGGIVPHLQSRVRDLEAQLAEEKGIKQWALKELDDTRVMLRGEQGQNTSRQAFISKLQDEVLRLKEEIKGYEDRAIKADEAAIAELEKAREDGERAAFESIGFGGYSRAEIEEMRVKLAKLEKDYAEAVNRIKELTAPREVGGGIDREQEAQCIKCFRRYFMDVAVTDFPCPFCRANDLTDRLTEAKQAAENFKTWKEELRLKWLDAESSNKQLQERERVLVEALEVKNEALRYLLGDGTHSDMCRKSWDVPLEDRPKWRDENNVTCPVCDRYFNGRVALAFATTPTANPDAESSFGCGVEGCCGPKANPTPAVSVTKCSEKDITGEGKEKP